jgi:ABC-type multidrug transport system fused ATPase/permease subunit
METLTHMLVFFAGLLTVILTLFSALSTFVLPRSARSQLNRIVFGLLRRLFETVLHLVKTYEQRDAIMAYYAPIAIMLLVPAWYILISFGYAAMYWALGVRDLFAVFRLSGSSLIGLGFEASETPFVTVLVFTEATIGLILVAMLIAYLPTMYSAFSRREQVVNMLEVRAGSPPSASEMLLRFHRNQGLEKLSDYWKIWEAWFADIEESHTTLSALVFFRSPRAENSWVTAAGAVLDAAAITLSAVEIPYEISAALCIRAGFLAFRRIANYFDIPNPQDPHYPETSICVEREEFETVLNQLAAAGLPLKPDREQAWKNFAGWRVNYDRSLILLCGLIMAPKAPWSGDRLPHFHLPPFFILKRKLAKSTG